MFCHPSNRDAKIAIKHLINNYLYYFFNDFIPAKLERNIKFYGITNTSRFILCYLR